VICWIVFLPKYQIGGIRVVLEVEDEFADIESGGSREDFQEVVDFLICGFNLFIEDFLRRE
jgi:hypothetical protein